MNRPTRLRQSRGVGSYNSANHQEKSKRAASPRHVGGSGGDNTQDAEDNAGGPNDNTDAEVNAGVANKTGAEDS